MTEWKSVTIKITDEELKIIEYYMKKFKKSRSHVIRSFMIGGITYTKFNDALSSPNSNLKKNVSPIMKKIFPKKIIKKISSEITVLDNKISPKIKENAITEFNKTKSDIEKFTKHNPKGAPKKEKKVGRPSKKDMSN